MPSVQPQDDDLLMTVEGVVVVALHSGPQPGLDERQSFSPKLGTEIGCSVRELAKASSSIF